MTRIINTAGVILLVLLFCTTVRYLFQESRVSDAAMTPVTQSSESEPFSFTNLDELESNLRDTDSIVPDPDYLRSSSRPNVFRVYVRDYVAEPLSQRDLDFFEDKLESERDDDLRMQCAALLYRYRRPPGERYLASRLDKADRAKAACFFALNHEQEYLSDILGIASASGDVLSVEFGNAIPLFQALGDWPNPKVADSLMGIASHSRFLNAYIAISIAKQGAPAGEPLIRNALNVVGQDVAVSYYFAALYLLSGNPDYLQALAAQAASQELARVDGVNSSDYQLAHESQRRIFAFEALGSIQHADGIALLQSEIIDLARSPSLDEELEIERQMREGSSTPAIYPMYPNMLRTAIRSLAHADRDLSPATAHAICEGLKALPEDYNTRLAVSVEYGTSRLKRHPALKVIVGERASAFAEATATLRKIPPYYLPESSRPTLDFVG